MRSRVFQLAIVLLLAPIRLDPLQTSHLTRPALVSQQLQDYVRKEVAEGCSVTKPSAQPFVPPPPYSVDHGPEQFWYGTESLWTLLSVSGTWNIRGNVLENTNGYAEKLTYWQRSFDWRKDKPELTVLAKRLDREAPIVAAEPANTVFVPTHKAAMMTLIDIPSTGCWKITARYHGKKLSFVVSVQH